MVAGGRTAGICDFLRPETRTCGALPVSPQTGLGHRQPRRGFWLGTRGRQPWRVVAGRNTNRLQFRPQWRDEPLRAFSGRTIRIGRVTKGPGGDFQPQWSTRRQNAWCSSLPGPATLIVWLVDGCEQVSLTQLTSDGAPPTSILFFSPDGSYIAFQSEPQWPAGSLGDEIGRPSEQTPSSQRFGVTGTFPALVARRGERGPSRCPCGWKTSKPTRCPLTAPDPVPLNSEIVGGFPYVPSLPDYSRLMDVVGPQDALGFARFQRQRPVKVYEFTPSDGGKPAIDYPVWSPDGQVGALRPLSARRAGDIWMLKEFRIAQVCLRPVHLFRPFRASSIRLVSQAQIVFAPRQFGGCFLFARKVHTLPHENQQARKAWTADPKLFTAVNLNRRGVNGPIVTEDHPLLPLLTFSSTQENESCGPRAKNKAYIIYPLRQSHAPLSPRRKLPPSKARRPPSSTFFRHGRHFLRFARCAQGRRRSHHHRTDLRRHVSPDARRFSLNMGITVRQVRHRSRLALRILVSPRSKVLYVETAPRIPLFASSIFTKPCPSPKDINSSPIIDNTFATPVLQNPIGARLRHGGSQRHKGFLPATPTSSPAVAVGNSHWMERVRHMIIYLGGSMDPARGVSPDSRPSKRLGGAASQPAQCEKRPSPSLNSSSGIRKVAVRALSRLENRNADHHLARKQMARIRKHAGLRHEGRAACGAGASATACGCSCLPASLGGVESLVILPIYSSH